MEVVIEEEEEEPRSKEMGPQVVGSQPVTTPTKSAKGQGIRKAKEIEGEGKKMKPYDSSAFEHGGRTPCKQPWVQQRRAAS